MGLVLSSDHHCPPPGLFTPCQQLGPVLASIDFRLCVPRGFEFMEQDLAGGKVSGIGHSAASRYFSVQENGQAGSSISGLGAF